MDATKDWMPAEPDLKTVLTNWSDPLHALSKANIPAIILRRFYNPSHCTNLIRRFIELDLMKDPKTSALQGSRIDIGTSLGQCGNDREAFFKHSDSTHNLFSHLFDGFDNPVKSLYLALSKLAPKKEVKVACEPDGHLYGPAIFRIHYSSHAYSPHIDHVTLREKRFNFSVTRFEHQFAGILCFQNASYKDTAAQTILHRCLWTPEIQPHIDDGTFHNYANDHQIEHYCVSLDPGDLYFFNTRCIHEIPALKGNDPRIVLAVFIGYSPDDNEIFVWS